MRKLLKFRQILALGHGIGVALVKGKEGHMKTKILTAIIMILGTSSLSFAAIPKPMAELRDIPPAVYPVDKTIIDNKTVQQVIPTNMPATEDTKLVQTKIVDHSLKNILNGDFFRNSAIGKLATKIEEATRPTIEIKSSDKKDAIVHKFDFQFEPQQRVAYFRYTGFLSSNINYDMLNNYLRAEAFTELSSVSRIGVVHDNWIVAGANRVTQLIYSFTF